MKPDPSEHEIRVMKMLRGDPDHQYPWGSWVGACLEFLSEDGLVTRGPHYQLTERGRAFLEDNDASRIPSSA